MAENTKHVETEEEQFFNNLKQKIEVALMKAARSDLDGVNGLNEIVLKFLILGILADKIQSGEVEVISEHGVIKPDNKSGFVDLFIGTHFGTFLIELKYLSLAFMQKVEPMILALNNHTQLANQLIQRRDNFLKFSLEEKRNVYFQLMDDHRIIRSKLVQNSIPFLTKTKYPNLISISVDSMIKLARAQVSEYSTIDAKDDIKRYVIVGVGTSVFIEKVETKPSQKSQKDDNLTSTHQTHSKGEQTH